nr:hypothetical protein KPHV_87110 [Kitasatospora purpeofusca]
MDAETVTGCEMPREVIPREYLAAGAVWPDGPLVADAPPGAYLGQAIAQALIAAMERQKIGTRELARMTGTGVKHPTILTARNGEGLPSAHTVLLLEIALKVPLYPAGLYTDLVRGQET